ncbi:MAG TPA: NAD(P)/FAD-dependent oxidoreductase [Candidatus Baltobacteraceae bacterium]|nr:NAD(P)/FAD-dependent oxidoreductase [Candidatus Baltobacteraceae bacterium]
MPNVVILGGGFAGFSAARELQRRRKRVRDLHVTLVDRNNFMLFTPMLPEAATGAVEVEHIVQAFRASLRAVQFELGEVADVDEDARRVHVRHPLTHEVRALDYDELVFALGSTPSTLGIEGVERWTLPLHSIADAQRVRNAVIGAIEVAARTNDVVERDRLLRFVLVGGGFTGVESAGELTAFIHAIVRYYPVDRRAVEIVLVENKDRLLLELPERFGKYAARSLRDRGVRLALGEGVKSVDENGVTLAGGGRLESRTILWDAGVEPSPFVKRLGLKTSRHAAIVVGPDFSVPNHPHLWAIGDCAAVPKKDGGTYAPLAQNAVREGPLLARNVIARLRGRRTRGFAYRELGQMASLGNRRALAELPGGRMLTGAAAWVLWRGYYLGQLPGTQNKTRVALDWMLGCAFSPSLARLPMVPFVLRQAQDDRGGAHDDREGWG